MDTVNFHEYEFACNCCGKNKINDTVILLCQKIRDALGMPIVITSGYRCEKHNAEIGGVKGSFHTKGKAADLFIPAGGSLLFNTIRQLYLAGKVPELGYCIRYNWGCHIDIVKRKSGRVFECR